MSGRVEASASEGGVGACSTLVSEIEHSSRFLLERRAGRRLAKSSRHNALCKLRETFLRIIGCRVVERYGEIGLRQRQGWGGWTILFHFRSLMLTISEEKWVGSEILSSKFLPTQATEPHAKLVTKPSIASGTPHPPPTLRAARVSPVARIARTLYWGRIS